jgi:hypothetical protein
MIVSGASASIRYCIIVKTLFVISGTTPTVQNLTIYKTSIEAKTTSTIQNTIGYNDFLPSIDITIDTAKTVTGQYNCFQDAAKSGSGTYTDTGTLWATNPLFTSAPTDFTPQVTSPCINSGTDVGLTEDYAGHIVGAIPDIGAYERMLNQGGSLHMDMGMSLT